MLAKTHNWDNVGSQILTKTNLVNMVKSFGRGVLKQRQVLNTLYKLVIEYKDQSVLQSLELMELLLNYGSNYIVLDYYFAFMIASH